MTLKDILEGKGSTVYTIAPEATLEEVTRELVGRNVGSLLVCARHVTEGERVFLAVRCILEARVREDRPEIDANLAPYLVDALLWRLDSANEPRPGQRARAAEYLGELSDPSPLLSPPTVSSRIEVKTTSWSSGPLMSICPSIVIPLAPSRNLIIVPVSIVNVTPSAMVNMPSTIITP